MPAPQAAAHGSQEHDLTLDPDDAVHRLERRDWLARGRAASQNGGAPRPDSGLERVERLDRTSLAQ